MVVLHLCFIVPASILILVFCQSAFSDPGSNLARKAAFYGDRFTYDANGNVIERGHHFYDKDGKLRLWHETYSYDADGHLIQKVRNDSAKFQYTYGPDGQLSNKSWNDTDGTHTIAHQYDSATGSLSSLSDGTQILSYAYYPDGFLNSTTYPDRNHQNIEQDQYGRVVGLTNVEGQSEAVRYNASSLPSQIYYRTDQLTNQYSSQDNPTNHYWGQIQSFTLNQLNNAPSNNHLTVAFHYNGFNQSSATETTLDSQPALVNTYDYDPLHRLTTVVKSSGIGTTPNLNFTEHYDYDYDSLSQLTNEKKTPGGSQEISPTNTSYVYDGNGNVISTSSQGKGPTIYYNALGQRTDETYDKNGRLIKDAQGNTYQYNELDQLLSKSDTNGQLLVSYHYYPDGLLAQRKDNDNTEQFYYRDGQVTAIKTMKDANNPIWTDFLLAGGKRLAAYSSDATVKPVYYLLTHHSTGASISGGALSGEHYDAYGTNTPLSNNKGESSPPLHKQTNKSFTWDQEYQDPATGLTYLRARFYNPDLMSFMSMDSAMVDNKYNFGNGDPINMIDPSGHMAKWVSDMLNGIGLAGAVLVGYISGGATVPLISAFLSGASSTSALAANHTKAKWAKGLNTFSLVIGVGASLLDIAMVNRLFIPDEELTAGKLTTWGKFLGEGDSGIVYKYKGSAYKFMKTDDFEKLLAGSETAAQRSIRVAMSLEVNEHIAGQLKAVGLDYDLYKMPLASPSNLGYDERLDYWKLASNTGERRFIDFDGKGNILSVGGKPVVLDVDLVITLDSHRDSIYSQNCINLLKDK